MRISDWSSDVCSSDLQPIPHGGKIRLSGKGVERVRSRPWTVHILVNAREHVVGPGTISFEELVALAFPQPPTGPQVCFTVIYRQGPPPPPDGSLLPGQSAHLIEGMTFHVPPTLKSLSSYLVPSGGRRR